MSKQPLKGLQTVEAEVCVALETVSVPSYLIDPTGVIRWVNANDLSVGRNVDEVLRVLDALQSDELCPCNWRPGQQTLGAA